jgi:hypothetical protein
MSLHPPSNPLRRAALAVLLTLCASACAVKPLVVEPPAELATTSQALHVTGRQGWQLRRQLSFGDYSTSVVKAAATHTRTQTCPNGCSNLDLLAFKRRFDEAFSTSTSKLDFDLRQADGRETHVQALSRLDQQHREWISRWFGLPTEVTVELMRQASFAGTIEPTEGDAPAWRFVVQEANDSTGAVHRLGWAQDDTGRRLTLSSLRHWQGEDARVARLMPGLHLGYAIELEGRMVAAVSTTGDGTVWLRDGLPADLRLSLASLASALLLRPVQSP